MRQETSNFLRFKLPLLFILILSLIALTGLFTVLPARADGPPELCTPPVTPVPLSSPTTVTDYSRQVVQNALDAGGHINFSCGPGAVTIPIDVTLDTGGKDIVLDGGGLVTLGGRNQTKILHNPWVAGGNTLVIQNMRFINGRAPAAGGLRAESGAAITSGSPGTRLHIINSIFENNATTAITTEDNQGGAIFSNNSYETVIAGSVFKNNSAGNGGAIGGQPRHQRHRQQLPGGRPARCKPGCAVRYRGL